MQQQPEKKEWLHLSKPPPFPLTLVLQCGSTRLLLPAGLDAKPQPGMLSCQSRERQLVVEALVQHAFWGKESLYGWVYHGVELEAQFVVHLRTGIRAGTLRNPSSELTFQLDTCRDTARSHLVFTFQPRHSLLPHWQRWSRLDDAHRQLRRSWALAVDRGDDEGKQRASLGLQKLLQLFE